MMELLLIALIAMIASLLTFFSGFGLGTILTPFFLLMMPVESAILSTAIVHLLNNLFKTVLIGGHLNWKYAISFGGAAIVGALLGAKLLHYFAAYNLDLQVPLIGEVEAIKFCVGLLIVIFALIELLPKVQFKGSSVPFLVSGGILSGFFGGISGHQGALRSAFLVKSGLQKEAFIATGIFIALCVDLARIPVYTSSLGFSFLQENADLILTAVLAAFLGAILGKRFMKKLTMKLIQWLVVIFMVIMGLLTMLDLL